MRCKTEQKEDNSRTQRPCRVELTGFIHRSFSLTKAFIRVAQNGKDVVQKEQFLMLPLSHLGPFQPARQRHSPVTGSQPASFLQSHSSRQLMPYWPVGHSEVQTNNINDTEDHILAFLHCPAYSGEQTKCITVLVLSKLIKNKRNRTETATQRFKAFCNI